MNVNYLLDYINPVILGICLLAGFAFKTAFSWFPNKYIPLGALCMGTVIAVLINLQTGIHAEVILGGMISGLASTGFYEMLRNLLGRDCRKDSENDSKKESKI